ncbi:MAG: pyridoxamine 5'-phosphate oxidase family protein [Thermomicrobiales bacterium]|nr:pyridoxamine 5'-phosphate oxidase family protein [Thermomicrobiales bacterium]
MGRRYDTLDETLVRWIERQPLVFVGTAPLAADGHINVSPKGASGTFKILGPMTVAYLDLVGSGAETLAHLHENGRIIFMFCAFNGPPKILRLHGRGRVIGPDHPEFAKFIDLFAPGDELLGVSRTVVVAEIERISDSCGYGVPLMEQCGERDQIFRWAEQKAAKGGPGWRADYIRGYNSTSVDGLPALDADVFELKDPVLES